MSTEDEILERVQLRATAIRRRQRMLVAGTVTAVALLLGGAVVTGSVGDRRDPVDAGIDPAEEPIVASTTVPAGDDVECAGSPSASTDGREPEDESPSGSRPAQGDPAGPPPTESSIPLDDPSAASALMVEASSTTCPLHVRIVAVHRPGSTTVDLMVEVTAQPGYDAHGYVVWDAAAPVQVDLGGLSRRSGSCSAGEDEDADVPVEEHFGRSTTYATAGAKQLTVTFWASRCEGPVSQVDVGVVVPL